MLFPFILHTHSHPFFWICWLAQIVYFLVYLQCCIENATDFSGLFHCLTSCVTESARCSLMWLLWKIERDRMFLKCTAAHLVVLWALSGMATVTFGQPLGLSILAFCLCERMHFIEDFLRNRSQVGYTPQPLFFLITPHLLLCLSFLFPHKETKESIAAGHAGRIAAVLLFRPECSLYKVCKGRMVV